MCACGFGFPFIDVVILLCTCLCSNKKRWLTTNALSIADYWACVVITQHSDHHKSIESKKKLPLFQQNVITHSQPGPKGSEVIGWRLATQESSTGFHFTKELSLPVLSKSPSKGQYICLSVYGVWFNALKYSCTRFKTHFYSGFAGV